MNPTAFNPTLEYDSLPDATYSYLGSHTCDCAITTINEKETPSYVMYPNPANIGAIVTINSNSKIRTIELKNILGENVFASRANFISTNNLGKGVYIICILFDDGKMTENKLIIE